MPEEETEVYIWSVWHEHDDLGTHSHHHHHGKPPKTVLQRRILFMADLEVGQSVTRTATAQYPNPDGSGTFLTDPNSPQISWTSDDAGAVITLTDNGSSASGVSSATYTGVGAGTCTVTVTSVDPDGNTISGQDPVNVTAAPAPAPSTDATVVSIA